MSVGVARRPAQGAMSMAVVGALSAALFAPPATAQWLPPECQPSSPATQSAVDALRALSSAVPEHRVAATVEDLTLGVSIESVVTAASAGDGAEAAALLTWLRWVAPAAVTDVPEPPPRDGRCGIEGVALLAGIDAMDRMAVDAVLPLVRALYETQPVPEAASRRLATHAYLATHAPLLEALADGEARQTRSSSQTAVAIAALARGARGDGAGMRAATDALTTEDAWRRWVRAEALRHTADWDEAAALCAESLDEDPLFAAAIFTRAAIRLRTGAAELTLSDVEHLRRVYGPEGPYHEWTDHLDSRQQR